MFFFLFTFPGEGTQKKIKVENQVAFGQWGQSMTTCFFLPSKVQMVRTTDIFAYNHQDAVDSWDISQQRSSLGKDCWKMNCLGPMNYPILHWIPLGNKRCGVLQHFWPLHELRMSRGRKTLSENFTDLKENNSNTDNKSNMWNIRQRSKNSNHCSVQWLPRGDHKIESWGFSGESQQRSDAPPNNLVPKLFIREAVVFHALAYGSLTPSLTLFNDKSKQKNKTTPHPPPPKKTLWLCNELVWLWPLSCKCFSVTS